MLTHYMIGRRYKTNLNLVTSHETVRARICEWRAYEIQVATFNNSTFFVYKIWCDVICF